MKTINQKLMNTCLSVILITLALLTKSVSAEITNNDINRKMQDLSLKLEQKRQDFHIPGMAIAIIKDNKVILSKGFGVSDLENNTAVTNKTLFGIGSTTKAFTATLIGMLADEDTLNWDDSVTKHLPYLKFNMEDDSDEITLRDMMSHQTGFTRFNLLYANGKVSRNDILHAATKAEPWAGFREKFLYTNLMVTAAGVAAAQSVDNNWESLLEDRLLKPLGMHNTTARFDVAQQGTLLSKGYMWLTEQQKHKQLSMHDITNIGPAGAINSNVEDMAKWLQLQLGNGTYKGKQLVSEEQIQETRKPQIKISGNAAYGLGWMLREYQGQKLVAHDGSVEGYSAIVALLPESNMGFVLLTNVTQTGLLGASMNMVFETLLEEEKTKVEVATHKAEQTSYEQYIGEYIANFASFDNAAFNFHVKDGIAYVDVPGQMDYELKAPDENGQMYFAITDTVSISFDKDPMGNVTALRMQQGGMNFELQKKGVPVIAEIDEHKLQKYLGKYASELFKGDLIVKIQNQRLTVDVPGQMAFELHSPDTHNHRHFRIKDTMSIVFEANDDNSVVALSVYKSKNKIDTATKNTDDSVEKLPSIADIVKLRNTEQRKQALSNSDGFRFNGKVTMKQSGIVGQVTSSFVGYDHFREEVDFGRYGSIITALNTKSAAIAPSFADFMQQHGKYFEQTQKMHPSALIDWQHYYEDIKVTGITEFNSRKAYTISLSGGKTPTTVMTIDAETGDVLKQESKMLNPTLGSIAVVAIYENYQEHSGLRIPFKVTVKNDFNGESSIEIESVEANLNFDPSLFKLNNPQSGE